MSVESVNTSPINAEAFRNQASSNSSNSRTEASAIKSSSDVSRGEKASDQVEKANNTAEMSVEKLEEAIDKLNAMLRDGQRSINFSVEQDRDQVVVKVIDIQTSEVVRQIPSEETLKFAEHLEGMLGLIFNDKA